MNSYKKNIGKRVVAVVMTLLLIATIIPVHAVSAATQKKVTKVTISNEIEVMNVGSTHTLKSVISPKSVKAAVVFSSSNKSIATVTKDGVVKAKKSGWVTITAKTSNGKQDKSKILVVSKYGYTSLQSKIDLMLNAKNIKYITISNPDKENTYIIKKGTYKDKTLTVNAPKSDVKNHARFKKIKIVDVKNGTFTEYASGNNIEITDDEFSLNIMRSASIGKIEVKNTATGTITINGKVGELLLSGSGSTLNLVANNAIGTIVISKNVNLVITGNASNIKIVVEEGAEGTTITASNPDAIQLDNQTKTEIPVKGDGSQPGDGNTPTPTPTPTPGGGTPGDGTPGDGTPGDGTPGDTTSREVLVGKYEKDLNMTIFTVPTEIKVAKVTGVTATAKKNNSNTSVTHIFTTLELNQLKGYYSLTDIKAVDWNNPNWTFSPKTIDTATVEIGNLNGDVRTVTTSFKDGGVEYKGSADVKLIKDNQYKMTIKNAILNNITRDPATIIINTANQTLAIEGYDLSDNVTITVTYTK